LAAAGFRAARDAHHYRVIQSLAHTLGADATLIAEFEQFRKKRNIGGYERAGSIFQTTRPAKCRRWRASCARPWRNGCVPTIPSFCRDDQCPGRKPHS
jgi:hypothetical protein